MKRYAGGLGASLSFDNNRYSGFFFLGAADVNYDLFVLGQPLRVEQQGAALQGEFRYGFNDAWSGGISCPSNSSIYLIPGSRKFHFSCQKKCRKCDAWFQCFREEGVWPVHR